MSIRIANIDENIIQTKEKAMNVSVLNTYIINLRDKLEIKPAAKDIIYIEEERYVYYSFITEYVFFLLAKAILYCIAWSLFVPQNKFQDFLSLETQYSVLKLAIADTALK